MASFTFALLVTAVALLGSTSAQEKKYSDRYDQVNLDGILAKPDAVNAMVSCFKKDTDEDCNDMGKRVKDVLPEVFVNDCQHCTERQKGGLAKVVRFLAKERPEDWQALQAKYDSQGAYIQKHPELVQ